MSDEMPYKCIQAKGTSPTTKTKEKKMKKYKAPKGIINHPAVEECLDADAQGCDGYKHDVFLKEGWVFKNGRTSGCRGCNFSTVADFRYAEPIKA